MTLIGDTMMWEQTDPKQLVRDLTLRRGSRPRLRGRPLKSRREPTSASGWLSKAPRGDS